MTDQARHLVCNKHPGKVHDKPNQVLDEMCRQGIAISDDDRIRTCVQEKPESGPLLTGSSDWDHAGDPIQKRSTSETLVQLIGNTVYCRAMRQPIVTISSTEAELVALTSCSLQVHWLKPLLI